MLLSKPWFIVSHANGTHVLDVEMVFVPSSSLCQHSRSKFLVYTTLDSDRYCFFVTRTKNERNIELIASSQITTEKNGEEITCTDKSNSESAVCPAEWGGSPFRYSKATLSTYSRIS